jgi:hypothetical protein
LFGGKAKGIRASRGRGQDGYGHLDLGYLSDISDDAMQVLVKLLHNDEDVFVRAAAAKGLGNLNRLHNLILVELLNSLENMHCSSAFPEKSDAFFHRYFYISSIFEALVQLSQSYDLVTPELERWIEQHQDWEFFGVAVDALWGVLQE